MAASTKPCVNDVLSNDPTLQALRLWLTEYDDLSVIDLGGLNLLVVSNACHTIMLSMYVCL